jgi:predicted RNA-binding Zn ribbon-like protein
MISISEVRYTMTQGESTTAASETALVLMLLNTRYGQRERRHDKWPDRAAMEDWLREHDLITAEDMVTEGDFRRAVAMREALRQLLRRPTEAGLADDDAQATLRGLASHLLLKVEVVSASVSRLSPESGGVDGFLAQVLAEMYTAMATGTWQRLKVCHNTACSRAFYDGSRNRSGLWCSAKACGNRMHAQTYRQQRRRPRQNESL